MSIAHNVRSTDDVDTLLARAERASAWIVKPAGPTLSGGYAGYFAEPDGHLWEIAVTHCGIKNRTHVPDSRGRNGDVVGDPH